MTELSGTVFEPLWEDGELILSRGISHAALPPLLVVAPASEQPAPGSLQRLEHSYALRDELDPAWAARPLALVHHQGRPTLLLEDPGGELLTLLLGHRLELTQFLRLAVGLSAALGQLHKRGLIHKDIKPADLREILSKSLTVRGWCKDEAYRWLESWRPCQQRNLAWR